MQRKVPVRLEVPSVCPARLPFPSQTCISLACSKVSDFVRQGPGLEEDLCFLFTLRLEDDYGVVDAVATGLDASCLLPGKPTPAQFRSSADVRQTAERLLARLESDRRSWLGLRLRSYVMPLKGARRGGGSGRADFCKHFSVVAPSSLEEGCGA